MTFPQNRNSIACFFRSRGLSIGISRSGGGLISRFGRPSAVRLSRLIGGKAPDGRRIGAAAGPLDLGGAGIGGCGTGGATNLGRGGACSGGNVLIPFSNVV